ncbi:PH domain-containing protein [Streptomyces sp. JW3]|uniref:PH domain-containing protein n=1 Tax=Streptomyces sp. JW3 TaxID=3456955 RepID=UPI003FA48F46
MPDSTDSTDSTDRAGIDREYRRLRTPLMTWVTLGSGSLAVLMAGEDAATSSGSLPHAVLFALFLTTVALLNWRAHTTVTATGITVPGPLRTRTWAWSEIHTIRAEGPMKGSSARSAHLYRTDGGRSALPQFDHEQLPDPVAEVDDLLATAVRLGLLPAEPRPGAAARVARGERRRKAGRRAGCCGIAGYAALLLHDFYAIFTDGRTAGTVTEYGVTALTIALAYLLLDRLGELRHTRRTA